MDWNPQGKERKRGRPRQLSWRRIILAEETMTWRAKLKTDGDEELQWTPLRMLSPDAECYLNPDIIKFIEVEIELSSFLFSL